MKRMKDEELTRLLRKTRCYYLPAVPNGEEVGGEPKRGHYYVGIVVEGEPGYFATDWDYGTDRELAQKTVDKLNQRMGLDLERANEIVLSSMFARK